MPELKNLFIKGKMNKDLDERLVPQGEYRDALNVSVSYSEGSDVGALQNILGNTERNGGLSFPAGATCIGTVRDTENDKVYWFGTSATADYIAELDPSDNSVDIILCDTGSILNFSTSNLITGVAVLDGILYFTDDLNEPRQVDIEYWRGVTATDFTTSTNLSADRITLIKKSPLNAPNLVLKNTKSTGLKTFNNGIPLNYVDKNPFIAGDQPLAVGDSITQMWAGLSSSYDLVSANGWVAGNKIKIHNENYDAFAIAELTAVDSTSYTYEIISIVGDFPDEAIVYKHSLVEEPILYEFSFARFAYRWKYEINGITQYSLISPFSEPAFIPGDFKYNTLKGFNLAMENTLQKITLNTFDTKPTDVVEVEILFKYSNSPNIYKIAELTTETDFSFEKEIKGEIIPSNQLLRSFDSIPKKAKALELSGNRLIFGNYTQNFDITKPAFEINLINRSGTSEAKQTIKSKRTYEFGVVYLDEYQRQTPVLTDKTGVFDVPYGGGDSLTSLFSPSQFKAKITSTAPSWATHYRYFIKENSNEYYNLALAGAFKTDNGFYYLSFPSAEVNKIQEGDFLVMKKGFNNTIVTEFEKNKVASIETEAPDEIAKEKITELNINSIAFSPALEDNNPLLVQQAGGSPTKGSKQFVLAGSKKVPGSFWESGDTAPTTSYQGEGLSTEQITSIGNSIYVQFSIGNVKTKYYKISSTTEADFLYYTTTNDIRKHLEITLEEPFTDDIDFLYEYRGADSTYYVSLDDYVLKPNISVGFFSENNIASKFDGLFFAKVQQNAVLNSYLQSTSEQIIADAVTLRTAYYLTIGGNTTGKWYVAGGGKAGTPDNTIPHSQGGADVFDSVTWALTIMHHSTTAQFGNEYAFRDSIKVGAKVRFKDYQATSANFAKEQAFMGVNTVTIQNGGTGYSSGTNVAVTGGSGENLTVNTTTTNNVITSVSIGNNAGAGYKTGDVVVVSGGDANATLTLTAVEDEIYTITDMRIQEDFGSNPSIDKFYLNFDKNFIKDLPFVPSTSGYTLEDEIEMEIIEEKEQFDLTKEKKPPIFETFPEESPLELYYETQETFNITNDVTNDHGNFNNLKWFNCFTFNNGVESNRIRDDYNAVQIDKGPKVSTTYEEEYKEERVKNGLIFSGLYNRKNGVNRLNQFIIAENITEEINPVYGGIQKLNTRDTDLTLFCDDKILKAPIRKDLLFQADGNPQLTSTDRFIGTIIPYQGNYGCQHPESFADHIYRAYFVDKTRGKVLRLGGDGITEISNYGMKDYFKDKLRESYNKIVGSYDENKDQYNVSFVTDFIVTSDTVSFSESVNGWPSRKSFIPEAGISLNSMYYTFKDGKIYSHDNPTRNTFYSGQTASTVTALLNGNPGSIKNFRTLNYQGDSGWIATATSSISTNSESGAVSSFVEKEGIYYNYIQGVANNSKSSLDLKSLNVQGLGTPTNITGNNITFSELNSALQVGDVIYNNLNDTSRIVTNIAGNVVTLDGTPTNAFNFFAKDNRFNTSGILGYYMQVTLSNSSSEEKELYSIGSEVSLSS
jgi:hypothetical protein